MILLLVGFDDFAGGSALMILLLVGFDDFIVGWL
jgi:hypothetical protein